MLMLLKCDVCVLCDRDLNFWGFDALSHPLNGLMMTEFRPVSCYTQQPLKFLPGRFTCIALPMSTVRAA